MTLVRSGKKDDPQPELERGQCILVDMWGYWNLYKCSWYSDIEKGIEQFVEDRKYTTSHFNSNYITKYERFDG